ncbi:hypothetical protein F5Y16DRAFT_402507 [Xylariaceae sp. FL0255]|nr:hypothetical protein F5Y16DRAFT_402507 [Xylariaceae sp. FL0255]
MAPLSARDAVPQPLSPWLIAIIIIISLAILLAIAIAFLEGGIWDGLKRFFSDQRQSSAAVSPNGAGLAREPVRTQRRRNTTLSLVTGENAPYDDPSDRYSHQNPEPDVEGGFHVVPLRG